MRPLRRTALHWLLGAVAAAGAAPTLPAAAQASAPQVSTLPSSVRAAALGGAYVLSAPDNDALFSNPAAVDSGGVGVGLALFGAGSEAATASGGTAWLGAAVGLGVRALLTGLPTGTGTAGGGGAATSLAAGGPVAASDVVLDAAMSHRLLGLGVGIGAEVLLRRRGTESGRGIAFDAGVTRRLGPVVAGLAARNMGRGLGLNGDGPLPTTVTLGAATRTTPVGPLDVVLAAAVDRLRDGTVAPGGGIELRYWPVIGRTFVARIGARRPVEPGSRALTLGAAFLGDHIAIEYAYRPYDAGPAHFIGLAWR
jgi:hypothetical protein